MLPKTYLGAGVSLPLAKKLIRGVLSMARRKSALVLAKLAEDPRGELKSMVADLTRNKPAFAPDGAKDARWSRRFTASGKEVCVPK